ncbi:MAG: hypothetical protein LBF92_09405 [Synergistaceae bacterium]|nr:hypothetical protein [Synergistaceae bacterium]
MSKRKFVLFALVAALVLGFAGSAMAGDVTWKGVGSSLIGDWNVPTNWEGGAPGAGDDVFIPAGSQVTVPTATAPVAKTVTFQAAAQGVDRPQTQLTLNAGLTVGDTGTAAEDAPLIKITAAHETIISGNADGAITLTDHANSATTHRIISVAPDQTLTIEVPVGGDGAEVTEIRKDGTGTLALTSDEAPANEPVITVTNGTLILSNEDLVALNSTIRLAAATSRLILSGDDGFTFAPASAATRDVTVTLAGATVAIDAGTEVTLGGAGASILTDRATVIVSGDLTIESTVAAFTAHPSVRVVEGGKVTIAAPAADPVFNNLTGDGSVVINRDLTIQPAAAAASFEFSGDISGSGGLTYDAQTTSVADTTAFTLSGTNTYLGDTTVVTEAAAGGNEGRQGLRLASASALSPASTLALGNANGAGRIVVAGDITLPNDINVTAVGAGVIYVPDGSKLTLTGELDVVNAANNTLFKRGPGELVLDGFIVPTTTGTLIVNDGTLTLASDGAADEIDLQINQNGTLNIPTSQTHTPLNGANNADLFANGAKIVAHLTPANLIDPNNPDDADPYLNVDGRLEVVGATNRVRIVPNFIGTIKKDQRLLVIDYAEDGTAAIGTYADADNFRVINADGSANTTDFVVEDLSDGRDNRGIALRALKNLDIAAPVDPTYSISPKLAADLKTITVSFLKNGATDTGLNGTFDYDITLGTTSVTDSTDVVAGIATIELVDELELNKTYTLTVSGIADYEGKSKTFGYDTTVSQPPYPSDYTWAADGSKVGDDAVFASSFAFNDSDNTIVATIYDPRLADLSSQKLWVWVVTPSGNTGTKYDLGSVTPAPVSGKPGYYTLTVPVGGLSDSVLEAAAKDFAVYYQAVEALSVRANSPKQSISTGGGNGGGGCDAGFGLFGLLAATGAVALLRRKG